MRFQTIQTRRLCLPASLLLLSASHVEAQQDEAPTALPTVIRKMGLDSGEKFLAEYYAFEEPNTPSFTDSHLLDEEANLLAANSSAILPFRPAFAPHRTEQQSSGWEVLARLQRRQWGCPSGTNSCEGIGYPYSCCHEGTTCYKIQDTGLGPVGCCASGQTCGGKITSCGSGDLACAQDLGGGCCIAGYVCEGVGCVRSSTVEPAPVQPTTFTTTSTSILPGAAEPSTVVVTVIVTQTPPSPGPTTRTTTQTTVPSSGSSSTGGVAPVKPTLTASSDQTASTPNTPSGYCPTGYYGCLATAGGGCCQTGRDCHTTSCPPVASTTIISNGATIVVPATEIPAAQSSTCADGWFLCPASAGPVPGCCPSGYDCGTASCSIANPSGTGTTEKKFPTNGAAIRMGNPLGVLSMLAMCVVAALVI